MKVTAENCGVCRFFLSEESLCRRFPPLAEIIEAKGEQITYRSFFPAMKPEGWCGEFKVRA